MVQAKPPTGNALYGFSQFGNNIVDELLYWFSYSDVRTLINDYKDKNLRVDSNADSGAYANFFARLLGISWDPRKVHAFESHWLTYASDVGLGEEDMPLDTALQDRTVDCEEHEMIANALLTHSGQSGDAVYIYYIPDDPNAQGEGHATKIVSRGPFVTLCNWGLINHFQSDYGFARDFISKANFIEEVTGRWEGDVYVEDFGDVAPLETGASSVVQTVSRNIGKFMPGPLKFDAGALRELDADYMKGFIERRNELARALAAGTLDRGTAEYAAMVRDLKMRNRLLRRPIRNLKEIQVIR